MDEDENYLVAASKAEWSLFTKAAVAKWRTSTSADRRAPGFLINQLLAAQEMKTTEYLTDWADEVLTNLKEADDARKKARVDRTDALSRQFEDYEKHRPVVVVKAVKVPVTSPAGNRAIGPEGHETLKVSIPGNALGGTGGGAARGGATSCGK